MTKNRKYFFNTLFDRSILNCQHLPINTKLVLPINTKLVRKAHKFPYGLPKLDGFNFDHRFFAGPLGIPHAAVGHRAFKLPESVHIPLPEVIKKINTITVVYLEKEEQAITDIYHRKLAHFSGLEHDEIRNGVECVYMPVDADRGLKLYKYRDDALNALESQAVASKYQIGPDVLSALMEFLFPIGSERDAPVIKGFFQQGIAYGYYTVKVDTQKAKEIYRENLERFDNLIDELKNRIAGANLNFPIHDLHNNNIGYIGDMLVAIDFGWHTTSKITDAEQERRHLE